jgi:hypothetical protein
MRDGWTAGYTVTAACAAFAFARATVAVAGAAQALDFVQQTVSVYTVSWLWTQLARASRQHWENLATHDPARNDVRVLLATICQDTTETHYKESWTPPQLENEPVTPTLSLPRPCGGGAPSPSTSNGSVVATSSAACAKPRPLSSCLAGGNWSLTSAPPLLLVGSHAMVDVFPRFDALLQTLWHGICKQCNLRCKGAPSPDAVHGRARRGCCDRCFLCCDRLRPPCGLCLRKALRPAVDARYAAALRAVPRRSARAG